MLNLTLATWDGDSFLWTYTPNANVGKCVWMLANNSLQYANTRGTRK